MVELEETVIYFLVGIKTFEISAYLENHIFLHLLMCKRCILRLNLTSYLCSEFYGHD